MRARTCRALFEVLLLTSSVGCNHPKTADKTRVRPAAASELPAGFVLPRPASRFVQRDFEWRQTQPRLPDTGEWRCADHEQVVWCAGGEAAAGVVRGPPDSGFRCAPRWGKHGNERVCIDQQPDYPPAGDMTRCSFEQEQGIARVCRHSAPGAERPQPADARPACWLDRDCPSKKCDRGACTCVTDSECEAGSCRGNWCVGVQP